jgi:ribonuclease P protein component
LLVPVAAPDPADAPPRAGLVVSRAVGGSVVRHRVARRLRHLLRPRLATLPAGSVLGDDLDSGLRAVLRRTGGRS